MLTVMSQNVEHGADKDGRWEGIVGVVRAVGPQLLLLQGVSFLEDSDQAAVAEEAFGLSLVVASSRNLSTAVAWNPERLELLGTETTYSRDDMHHGYCAPLFTLVDGELPAPLVAISTHLTPYSAQATAQEAEMLRARVYRYGGLAIIGGVINHVLLGDGEPDWACVPPCNRNSRCLRRQNPSDVWQGSRVVGETFRDSEFTDVAAHLAEFRHNPCLREATGRAGQLCVDQAHVTPALVPAIDDYWRVDPGNHSDHLGLAFTLDLSRVSREFASTDGSSDGNP